MKTKYTKGPWHIHAGVMAGEFTIWSKVDEAPIATGCSQANAQLVSAAPDMFEALELFLKIEDGPEEQHAVVMNTMKAYAKMREAVKKAKGE